MPILLSSVTDQIGFMPSGVVLPFAGGSAPSGWLLCDGSSYSTTTYAKLFGIIGSTYNTQINPSTGAAYTSPGAGLFRVPDYRSLFLRGTGTNNLGVTLALGDWQTHGTNKNALALTNTTVASAGMSANSTHSHSVNLRTGTQAFQVIGTGNSCDSATPYNTNTNSADVSHVHNVTSNVSMSNGDTETRPQNKAVNYIIKV
jgi:microcystin-dependent protein